MACRKIMVMGHPVLRRKAEPVAPEKIVTPEIQTLLKDMVDTMVEYDGRGLAAPQIAESLQILVMIWDFKNNPEQNILYAINPTVEIIGESQQAFWEGCLSLPGLRGKVRRPTHVKMKALNEKAEPYEMEVEGFGATVIQHEFDHLNGVLYIDRIEDFTTMAYDREYRKYLALP